MADIPNTLYPFLVYEFKTSSKFSGKVEGLHRSLIFSGEPLQYALKKGSFKFFPITVILCNLLLKSNLLTIAISYLDFNLSST